MIRKVGLMGMLIAGFVCTSSCGDDDGSSGDGLLRTQCPGDPTCPDQGDGVLYAGTAVVDITPLDLKEGPTFQDFNGDGEYDSNDDTYEDQNGNRQFDAVWIAGFGSSRPAMGVHDPIEARILALRHNQTTVVMISADFVGFFYDHLQGLRELLPSAVAAEVDLVVFTSTHNHEGPDMLGIWGRNLITSGLDPEYLAWVQNEIAAHVGDAVAAMEPASVVHGAITVEDATGSMEHLISDTRDPVIIDNTMNVMRFYRKSDDTTIATVVNLGSHPEALWSHNNLISSDFPHYLRLAVENGVPGGPEGVGGVAIYVQGSCGGLIGPARVHPVDPQGQEIPDPHSFEAAEALGQSYAHFALRALDPANGAVDQQDAHLAFRTRQVYLRVDNFNYQAAYRLGILSRMLHNFDPDAYIDENNTPDVLSELVYLQIGVSSLVTVPGELAPEVFVGCYDGSCAGTWDFVDPNNLYPPDVTGAPQGPYLRDVLAEDGSQFQWLVGLGQDEVGYILPNYDYVLDEGSPYLREAPGDHYEETNSLGPLAHDQITQPLIDLVRGQ